MVQIASLRTAELSAREWEILDLLREGLATRQIAERLFLSDVTVRSHVSSVLRKLDVPDRAAAVRLLEQPPDRHLRAVG